jgi:hypothetical protein
MGQLQQLADADVTGLESAVKSSGGGILEPDSCCCCDGDSALDPS